MQSYTSCSNSESQFCDRLHLCDTRILHLLRLRLGCRSYYKMAPVISRLILCWLCSSGWCVVCVCVCVWCGWGRGDEQFHAINRVCDSFVGGGGQPACFLNQIYLEGFLLGLVMDSQPKAVSPAESLSTVETSWTNTTRRSQRHQQKMTESNRTSITSRTCPSVKGFYLLYVWDAALLNLLLKTTSAIERMSCRGIRDIYHIYNLHIYLKALRDTAAPL